MIGTIRFVLASLVVANHVYLPTANRVGAHAVAAFYMISGFLMTRVIQEVYGTTPSGTGRFFVNRFLRIYPPYWVFLSIALLLLWASPTSFGRTYPNMLMPSSDFNLLRNVTLYDLPRAPEIVIPPAWTLTVEVFFYIAMGLVLSRARSITALWFIASLAITVWLIAIRAPFSQRYTPTYAASMFFSTGALIYFYRDRLQRWAPGSTVTWIVFMTFCVTPLLTDWIGLPYGYVGFYGAAALFTIVLVTAMARKTGPLDRWLGDLAYPVFITHLLAAGLVRMLRPNITPMSLLFFLTAYGVSIAISALFVRLSAPLLEPVRARVRHA